VTGQTSILCAGWSEDDLTTVDDVLELAMGDLPPVLVVGREDMSGSTLSELTSQAQQRDHCLPTSAPKLKYPIVIFAGMNPEVVRLCLSGMKDRFPKVRNNYASRSESMI
jgi:hypothetical protein